MESNDGKVLDVCGQGLKKISRSIANENTITATEIRLDNNEIQKLEFLSPFQNVQIFSASHNNLLRMYPIQTFHNLIRLDLSYNKIICIEGLKEMPHLVYLNLEHNKIKEIEHQLQKNKQLEYLNVSDNLISGISNLSHLTKLKTLLLHNNQITSLRHCELYLPKSLEMLTLARNKLKDLNEVCHLVDLINLREITICGNPCVDMTGDTIGFNYRPFLLNWCLSLKVIDGYALNDIECLRAEWLYSHGMGRKFRPGEHSQLIRYLSGCSNLTDDKLHSVSDKKLELILRKAREIRAPINPQIGGGRVIPLTVPAVMSRSLDPSFYKHVADESIYSGYLLSKSLHCTSLSSEKEISNEEISAPLPAASKLVPVPESLVSPMVANIPDIPPPSTPKIQQSPNEIPSSSKLVTSVEDSYPPCRDEYKLHRINKIAEGIVRKFYETKRENLAAIYIQKIWRGYRVRRKHNQAHSIAHSMKLHRVHDHVLKLSEGLESVKSALENEHKVHVLQMQAINALWRKLSSFQLGMGEDPPEIKKLTATCERLTQQVQQLQGCMQEVMRCVGRCVSPSRIAVGTQTEIVAVHTPPEDSTFPYNRPSTLPLTSKPVSQYESLDIVMEETDFSANC